MRHVLSVLVENEPGVLSRVAGLFSGRGFNVESINAAATVDPEVTHMTITTEGDEAVLEQIVKQLRKVVTVAKVVNFQSGAQTVPNAAHVEREIMLVKVCADDARRNDVMRIADIFRCKVIDVSPADLTLEATGTYEKLQAMLNLLVKFGVKDMIRSGVLAMRRSMQSVEEE